MMWIFRGSTAVGAFFLILLVNEIKDMHQDIEKLIRADGMNDVRIESHTVQIKDLQRRVNQIQHID